jgi:hypothetical protein
VTEHSSSHISPGRPEVNLPILTGNARPQRTEPIIKQLHQTTSPTNFILQEPRSRMTIQSTHRFHAPFIVSSSRRGTTHQQLITNSTPHVT